MNFRGSGTQAILFVRKIVQQWEQDGRTRGVVMNWLVTGGCGFLGTALIRQLVEEGGHAVRVVDNLSVGTRADLGSACRFIETPSGDVGPLPRANGASVVEDPGEVRHPVPGLLQEHARPTHPGLLAAIYGPYGYLRQGLRERRRNNLPARRSCREREPNPKVAQQENQPTTLPGRRMPGITRCGSGCPRCPKRPLRAKQLLNH